MLKLGQIARFDKLNSLISMFLAALSTVLLVIDRYLIIFILFILAYYVYIAYRYSGFVGKKFKAHQYVALVFIFIVIASFNIAVLRSSIQFEATRDLWMIFIILLLDFFASFMAAAFLNSIFAKRLDVGSMDH